MDDQGVDVEANNDNAMRRRVGKSISSILKSLPSSRFRAPPQDRYRTVGSRSYSLHIATCSKDIGKQSPGLQL